MPWGRNAPWDGGGVRLGELVASGLTLPQGKLAGNTAAAPGIEAIGIGPGLRLDETTKELSVVGETFDGVVQNWADLPVDGSVEIGALYIVRESSGTWLLNRKQRGLYQRVDDTGTRATDWQYLGEWLEEFSDANWSLYNASDSTKTLKFALAGLSTGVVATLTVLGSATLNDWFDQSVKTAASPTFAGLSVGTLVTSGAATIGGALSMLSTNSGSFVPGTWSRDANWGTYYRAPATGASADLALFDNAGDVSVRLYAGHAQVWVGGSAVFDTHAGGSSVTGTIGASANVWSGNNGFSVTSGTTDGAYLVGLGQVVVSAADSPTQYLRRRSSDGALLEFYRDTTPVGSIIVTTTGTTLNTSSDARLKTDLGAFSLSDLASPLYSLRLRKYAWDVWLASEDPATRDRVAYGVFAQEAAQVCPWMTNYDAKSDLWSVNWMALQPNIVAGLQVHETKLNDHETRIAALEAA